MKKIIALLLSCLLCATCFAVFASAEEYGAASLLPNPDGEMTAEGCEVKVNSNGSVTVTLTAATASIKMIYKDGTTVYEEPYSEIADYPYIAYWYVSDSATVQALAHYDRKDKTADLYLAGMRANPNYYKVGDANTNYGAWNIYEYLSKGKGADFVTGDYAVLRFFDIEYTFSGNVGDEVTFYYYGTIDEIPEGFGTDVPSDDPVVVDPSEEPSKEDSSAVVEPSVEPSADESKGGTEPTSDSGIIALAVIASLAVAGAVITKKVR